MTGSHLIKYENQIYKDPPNRKSNQNFQLHFQYIRDRISTKIVQVKKRICHVGDLILRVSILRDILKALLNSKNIICVSITNIP